MNQLGALVCIVDDELSIRESLSDLLQSTGLNVQAFASAQEFLTSLPLEAVGCLVLDVQLPGISGLDLQQELAIHQSSRCRENSLVRVNCTSIPKELFESEFFGHAKGAFTGAIRDRAGRFEAASGRTLFLDEVAEIPLELQSKLLRVLQEKSYERVGEESTRRADVRIVAATNRDLKKEVAAGRFREDLYYRLNVFPLKVAPLRERKEDIPLFATQFIELLVRELGCPKPRLTRAGVETLQGYDLPGNIRELKRHRTSRHFAQGSALDFDLPGSGVDLTSLGSQHPDQAESEYLTEATMRRREREKLFAVLQKASWKTKGANGAAELLGVKPTTLISRIAKMGLKRPAMGR